MEALDASPPDEKHLLDWRFSGLIARRVSNSCCRCALLFVLLLRCEVAGSGVSNGPNHEGSGVLIGSSPTELAMIVGFVLC
jgi:hypothetical protein